MLVYDNRMPDVTLAKVNDCKCQTNQTCERILFSYTRIIFHDSFSQTEGNSPNKHLAKFYNSTVYKNKTEVL